MDISVENSSWVLFNPHTFSIHNICGRVKKEHIYCNMTRACPPPSCKDTGLLRFSLLCFAVSDHDNELRCHSTNIVDIQLFGSVL